MGGIVGNRAIESAAIQWNRQRLAALLRRRRERHYFEVPWRVADYDSDPPRAMNP